MADTKDLKSFAEKHVGSTPTPRTLVFDDLWVMHPKQKEFMERKSDVFFAGAYPQRATGAITKEMIKRFIDSLNIKE